MNIQAVLGKTDHIRQAIEEAGEEKDTSFSGGGVGTGEQKSECCSEDRVYRTHRGKEARPHEETWPKETFPQR